MSRTYVAVTDERWRFDPETVFSALEAAYADLRVERRGRTINAYDFSRGWEVSVLEDHSALVIGAPTAPTVELVAWVRGFVPAEVDLRVFDEELGFGPEPLPPGITPGQVRQEFFGDAADVADPQEPPSLEERMRFSGPPPRP